MNTLELKGGMIELIAKVNNTAILEHLYELISEVLSESLENDTLLTPEQETMLSSDIEASKNPKNLVDHQVAMKKMSKWLEK